MYNQIDSNKRKSIILMMIFIAIIIGLGYIFDQVWNTGGTYLGVWIAIIVSLSMTALSYFTGDKIALSATGARPITKEENGYVYRLVENLSITAGLPMPKIYIIEDSAINAFATGRKPEMASIAVTRGAIDKLENEELEGVLAHELSHVKNYDIRFMTMVAVLVGAIVLLSDIFIRGGLFGGHGHGRKGSGGILIIVGIVLAILSPLIAEMIKMAISRKREYLADADGSLLTRYPEGLARALEKINQQSQPMQSASKATAHLFFANPFSGKKISSLFSTHPPIEDRVKQLRGMA
ncbi:MAG: zinc metalloprotease HtpX [Candidatus Magasanikbacteria bacterium CG10_big_fil_rev_8_21_14_0_10_40_10]|uniref:Protease HtpX homolog n=1 Tax=Candidatus Magasanikbacteria bacterium CG10_big_fil_rev_8_21_14_0_10_40_10 TaxID=1974648 RepID=A0A2M6W4D8_9BACT|nr:MAG: zinc metalloprotease HtpX [Candidatus Magasanikbacteria bacterium CG10_big_fil_rev_8_21_14_0_10_40_10]